MKGSQTHKNLLCLDLFCHTSVILFYFVLPKLFEKKSQDMKSPEN